MLVLHKANIIDQRQSSCHGATARYIITHRMHYLLRTQFRDILICILGRCDSVTKTDAGTITHKGYKSGRRWQIYRDYSLAAKNRSSIAQQRYSYKLHAIARGTIRSHSDAFG